MKDKCKILLNKMQLKRFVPPKLVVSLTRYLGHCDWWHGDRHINSKTSRVYNDQGSHNLIPLTNKDMNNNCSPLFWV
jgi:hypothetical protein